MSKRIVKLSIDNSVKTIRHLKFICSPFTKINPRECKTTARQCQTSCNKQLPGDVLLKVVPFRGFLRKSCSENMQQIYRRTSMLKQLYWNRTSAWVFSWNFLHIFRIPFPKNTHGRMFRKVAVRKCILQFLKKVKRFFCELCEILKIAFLQNICEWVLLEQNDT